MDNTKSKRVFYQIIITLILVLGITLRTIVFQYRDAFEDDECRLILAFLDKNWLQIFLSIGDAQSAPPFFIMIGKILGNITGYYEQALKLIPYIASLGSILVFYRLSEKLFVKNYTKILANILFAINFKLIIFSSIFKQYSTDVLVCMLCLLLLPKINFDNLNRKNLAAVGIILILLPFISLPSMFFIGTFFLINIKHLKKLLPIIIPFCVMMALYYCYNLYPSKISLDTNFPNYWNLGFIKFGNILMILKMIFGYFFSPNHFVLFETILFLLGIYFTVKDKSVYNNYILISFGLIILASFLHLYPLEGRVALYCVPILIFFMLKPLEGVQVKSYKFIVISLPRLFMSFILCNILFSLIVSILYSSINNCSASFIS